MGRLWAVRAAQASGLTARDRPGSKNTGWHDPGSAPAIVIILHVKMAQGDEGVSHKGGLDKSNYAERVNIPRPVRDTLGNPGRVVFTIRGNKAVIENAD